MAAISEDTWKKILNNQKFPLIGTNKPNNGNGYNDGLSWRIDLRTNSEFDESIYFSTFYTIFLRDLGLFINPSYSRKDIFEQGLKINNYTKNYYNTLLKYLGGDSYFKFNNLLELLGQWGECLSKTGRVIYEIIGWYDNESGQFYGFELSLLKNEYCRIKSKNIIYNAPVEIKNNKKIYKKVTIPKNKCIVIEFPKELGGYLNFKRKIKRILNLGNQFQHSANPSANLTHSKNWDKEFNKIVSDWGAYNKQDDVTEFYQLNCRFRFTYMVILCTLEIINGLKQLIDYLNEKFGEKVDVKLEIKLYDIKYFKEMQNKWASGNLSFKEANEFLKL